MSKIYRDNILEIKGHDEFVKELRKITGLSVEYCSAAFFTLEHWRRKNPKKAAKGFPHKVIIGLLSST